MSTAVLTKSSEEVYLDTLSKMKEELNYDELLATYSGLKELLLVNVEENKDAFVDFLVTEMSGQSYKHLSQNLQVLSKLVDSILSGTFSLSLIESLREEGLKMFTFVRFAQIINKELAKAYKELIVEPLVNSVGPLILSLVRKDFKVSVVPFSERVALATEGTIKAAWRYEPDSGYKFTTYCAQWIRATINQAVNGYTTLKVSGPRKDAFYLLGGKYSEFCAETDSRDIREFVKWLEKKGEQVPYSAEEIEEIFLAIKGSSLESLLTPEDMQNRTSDDYLDSSMSFLSSSAYYTDPEKAIEENEFLTKFEDVISEILLPQEKEVFMRIALEGAKQSDLADELGYSRQYISELYRKAIKKIKNAFPSKDALLTLSTPDFSVL